MKKIKDASWIITLLLILMLSKQNCKLSSKLSTLDKKIEQLPTKVEVSKEIQIEGFKTSKRTLYDNNAIIRTTVRPDDKMNEYDEEIKKLEKK